MLVCRTPPMIPRTFNTVAIANPTPAIVLFLNVGVTKKIKNSAYKYQYGDAGWRNSVSNKPPILSLVEPENTVFKSHVAKENVK